MKLRFGHVIAACAMLLAIGTEASAAPRNTKVLVAAPTNDVLAGRVAQELRAVGFTPLPWPDRTGCSPAAVEESAAKAAVIAAVCTDGKALVVWSMEGHTIRLKDFVNPPENDREAIAAIAIRAAEVTRAQVKLDGDSATSVEKTASPEKAKATAGEVAGAQLESIEELMPEERREDQREERIYFEVPTHKRGPEYVSFSLGPAALIGVDVSIPTISTELELGVSRRFAPFLRLEIPAGSEVNGGGSGPPLRLRPGFAAAGGHYLFASNESAVQPRVGAGLAYAWMSMTSVETTSDPPPSDLRVLAGFIDGALSIRIAGPIRFTPNALLGSSLSRMVAQSRNVAVAYWGQPIIVLAARAEVQF
jgi:hypothetical protein